MIIERENETHHKEVFELVKAAFAGAEHSDGNEHKLVERLRHSPAFVPELSLIAKIEDKITGHVMFTKAKINGKEVLALAPLAVHPEHQNKGVGSALIKEGIKKAKEMGFGGVIVLGNPDYYKKFGFKEAGKWKISAPFKVEEKFFMALEMIPDTLIEGTLEYAAEFMEIESAL